MIGFLKKEGVAKLQLELFRDKSFLSLRVYISFFFSFFFLTVLLFNLVVLMVLAHAKFMPCPKLTKEFPALLIQQHPI